MTTIGYARVSTRDQSLDVQLDALRAAGCTRVFREKVSGAREDRQQLKRMLKSVEPGDTVIVVRLDRLARSTRDLLNLIHAIDQGGCKFRSLSDAWADTTTPHGRLMLTVLAGLAEFERSLIMARVEAGVKRARENGVHFGRPIKLNTRQKRMVAQLVSEGERMRDLAKRFGVGVATIHRAVHGG